MKADGCEKVSGKKKGQWTLGVKGWEFNASKSDQF